MSTLNGAEFPPELLSIEDKKMPEYGLKYVKAMVTSFNQGGNAIFANNGEKYDALTAFAQGRQSTNDLHKLFGFHEENKSEDKNLHYIDIQILNIAATKINQIVEKLCNRKYDISATNVDALSNDHIKQWKSAVQTAKELESLMAMVNVQAKDILPELNLNIAEIPDEYLLEFDMPPKHKMSMNAEKTLRYLFEACNYDSKERDVTWDTVVYGHGIYRVYYDKNMIPRLERVMPSSFISSYSRTEDYSGIQHAGHYEEITPAQFISESSPYLTKEEQEEILAQHKGINSGAYNYRGFNEIENNLDGLTYIPVLRYTFLSEDRETYVKKKTQYNNVITKKRMWDFDEDKEPNKEMYEKNGGDWKVIRTTETNVYGGTWVVGSELVYGHDIMDLPASNIVDRQVPYIVLAPNMKESRFVSIASQMIEPVYMANVAWNKVKDIIAREWVGIMEVDFSALESINMGKGGTAWSPREVMDFLLKKKIAVTRKTGGISPNSPVSTVDFKNTGVQLADYFNTIQVALQMLDAVSGTGVADSSSPPERTGLGVMQQAAQASNNALGQLYFAKRESFKNICRRMLPMAQMSLKDGNVISGFIPAIGGKSAEFFEAHKDLSLYEFGIIIENRPSDEEWFDFRQALIKSLDKGAISSADYAFLTDIDNLKQARMTLAAREKKNIKQSQDRENQLLQVNQQNALEANNQATENQLRVEQQSHQNKLEQIELDGMIKYKIAQLKSTTDATNKNTDVSGKIAVKEIEGIDKKDTQMLKNLGDLAKSKENKEEKTKSTSKSA